MNKVLLRAPLKLWLIFTLVFGSVTTWAVPPTITSFSPLSGAVGTLVTIIGTNLNNPTAFKIGGVQVIEIYKSSDTLRGMVMTGATSGVISITTGSGTVSTATSFTVNITPYPTTQQGQRMIGTPMIDSAWMGRSVSISADGNTAAVGGDLDSLTFGAVWIYVRKDTTWTQQAKLRGTGGIDIPGVNSGVHQGRSVAVSADGNILAIGGNNDDSGRGAIWIFTRSDSTWTQQTKFMGTGAVGSARQGTSIALSADGSTLVEGGPADNGGAGAIWVFTRSGNTWTQQGSKLSDTVNGYYSSQGISVAISADGNTIAEGGNSDNNGLGAAWIYHRSSSIWTLEGKVVGTGGTSIAQQGISVALDAAGNTLVEGGSFNGFQKGAVWIFDRVGTTWTQNTMLIGSNSYFQSRQGESVSISADGNTMILGGIYDNTGVADGRGSVWTFTRTGGVWSQKGGRLKGTNDSFNAHQGSSSSLSADGTTLIEGGYFTDGGIGGSWVFAIPPISLPVKLIAFNAQPQGNKVKLGWEVANQKDMAHYIIERSSDGDHFTVFNITDADSRISYSTMDNTPLNGRSYYRLKMEELDGSSTFSKIVSVMINSSTTFFQISPVPANDLLQIKTNDIELTGTLAVLADVQGQTLRSFKLIAGKQDISLDGLQAGIYVLRLVNGISYKVVKE